MALIENSFDEQSALTNALTDQILVDLQTAIEKKGRATLAVSGGSTPKPLFQKLSESEQLEWKKVTVMLVDERWVEDDDAASNQTLVKQHLLINAASKATYFSIKDTAVTPEQASAEISSNLSPMLPLDVVILGMGTDAHTASLFPCSKELKDGLDLTRQLPLIATTPTTAPHRRISLSLKSIISASKVYLHITGAEKLRVLKDAVANGDPMQKPIAAVAQNTTLNLMWAP